jgi:hypothetical protein
MKTNGRIVAVAMGLVLASAGVLYPIHGTISAAREESGRIESELDADRTVHQQLLDAQEAMNDVQRRVAERPFGLCPGTPEAQHEFEAALMGHVESSGLHSVRMDRREEARDGRYATLTMDLVVEGDAFALQRFLQAVEEMRYVTRVTSLVVEPGAEVRRMNLQIAVMLESMS